MANLARGGEPRGDVVRVGRRLVDVHVTRRAQRGSVRKLVIGVALHAGRVDVSAGERKSRGGVVEGGTQPVARVVTQGAIRRNTSRGVIRVRGARVILDVATVTGCRRARETVARVATGAIQRGMHPHQRKSRETRMVELHRQPVVGSMALLTEN